MNDNFLLESISRSVFLELQQSGYLYGDYVRGKQALFERHGVKSDIEEYAKVLKKHLMVLNQNDTVVINDNIFKNINGCFFENLHLTISPDLISSMAYPVVMNKRGKIHDFKCDIKTSTGISYNEKVNQVIERFYHEFNHVYEEYCRLMKGAPSMFSRITDNDSVYRKITSVAELDEDNKTFRDTIHTMNQILYLLDDTESNAFTASVHASLTDRVKEKIENIQKEDRLNYFNKIEKVLTDIIKNDPTYIRFEKARENINTLSCEIYRAYYIETYWKELFDKETSFRFIIKNLKNLFNKKWKHFRTIASKAVYDAYIKYTIRPVPELDI